MSLLAILLLAALAAAVVTLVWAFVSDVRRPDVTQPLRRITDLYFAFMVLYVGLAAWRVKDGLYSAGRGRAGSVCVGTGISGTHSDTSAGWQARPGGSVSLAGDVQACVLHPSAGQWALFLLTQLPGLLLWGGVLLMILRLIRHATQHGPFTPPAASLIRQLGWLIIGGSAIAGALNELGSNLLTYAVVRPLPFDASGIVINVLERGALGALFPVPAIAGAALISFGRITRVGAVMDEELRATV